MELETLRAERSVLRRLFTTTLTKFDGEQDKNSKLILYKQLCDKAERLFDKDNEVLTLVKAANVTEDELLKEYEGIETYRDKFTSAGVSFESISVPAPAESGSGGDNKHYRLPKLELKKFDVGPRTWIAFWAQFQRIHDDSDLTAGDKFQYLLQTLQPNSKARLIVESYPPAEENYEKALEQLKKRFGREDIMIEVYTRDLLGLVLEDKQRKALPELYDRLSSQLNALEALGVTTDKYAAMLLPLVESAIPMETLKVWERYQATQRVDEDKTTQAGKLSQLMKFLRSEVEGEERIELTKNSFSQGFNKSGYNRKPMEKPGLSTAAALVSHQGNGKTLGQCGCVFCDGQHAATSCRKAHKFSLEERKAVLSRKGGCFNCLETGHISRHCKDGQRCPKCDRRHHPLLCQGKEEKTTQVNTLLNQGKGQVLLQTMMVDILGNGGKKRVRVLLDSGSQRSYIVTHVAEGMGLQASDQEVLSHGLFGGTHTKQVKHQLFKVTLCGLRKKNVLNMELLGQEKICSAVPRLTDPYKIPNLKRCGVWLSDIGSETPEIDILIGADIMPSILTGQLVSLKEDLMAIETLLGWTVMGRISGVNSDDGTANTMCLNNLTIPLTHMWELETLGIEDPIAKENATKQQERAIREFKRTITEDDAGRYCVNMPWIEDPPPLEPNRELCVKRLISLSKRLQATGNAAKYDEVLQKWVQEGIVEKVTSVISTENTHYVPHQAVIKESSPTTRVRPVFDCSAKGKNGVSLNDCVEKGPNLIRLIPELMLHFRLFKIGATADIKQAFLQIQLAEKDRDFLRFLWWKNEVGGEIETLRHTRVVFGVAASPFLLAATLDHHLQKMTICQQSAEQLRRSFYVDNCVTSCESVEHFNTFMAEANVLMAEGKFELRQWAHSKVADGSFDCCQTGQCISSDRVPVLGLLWDCTQDTLRCNEVPWSTGLKENVTKRKILSSAHQLFDPLGFTCPVTLVPRLLLRECWRRGFDWDEPVSEDLEERFRSWLQSLEELDNLRLPRWCAGGEINKMTASIHVFTDASQDAYAACVFLRVTAETVHVQLLQAKVRVAPTQSATIPRLELMAAVIGARLSSAVRSALKNDQIPVFHWTDSMIVLCWIRRSENWNIFVRNRVNEIKNLTDRESWHHIPGEHNPADIPSRGASVRNLLEQRWWEGPAWLRLTPDEWPSGSGTFNEDEVNAERCKTPRVVVLTNTDTNDRIFQYFSSYSKTVRMVGWMLRFKFNCRSKERRVGDLTEEEKSAAERSIWGLIQRQRGGDIEHLQVYKGEDGILRLQTKLLHGPFPHSYRCPVVLPDTHPIVRRLIEERHVRLGHPGVETMICLLREEFWVPRVRRLVKQITRACTVCRRQKAKAATAPVAALPPDRVADVAAFDVTGVDTAGPLFLRNGEKAWIILFTCAVYRAVHLELVQSLSTEAFLMALRRFIGRRGRPLVIYSDHGTNFVGAARQLANINWNNVQNSAHAQNIRFCHNPPTAAWWGGWWERLIGMMKQLLRRNLGKATLTYEELNTVLIECESLMNMRPLTYVGSDPGELRPITPACFIQDTKGKQSDSNDLNLNEQVNFQGRLRYRVKLMEGLRQRFRKEYLGTLVQAKDNNKTTKITVGDVVLIGSDNKKRVDWPLAVVSSLREGRDGVVRVAEVRTATGTWIRPVQRLYPLEITCQKIDTPGAVVESTAEVQPMTETTPIGESDTEPTWTTTRAGRQVIPPKRLNLSCTSCKVAEDVEDRNASS